jgi:chloramphenicol 3-O phosphotransferase
VDALQAVLAAPWFHLSLDDFRSGFSERWWIDDDGQLFERVMAAYLGSLRQIARAGIDVLAESVITPARQRLYESTLGETPTVLVGVQCPIEVAIERERTRSDRPRGPVYLDADEYIAVHAGLSYDLEVVTTSDRPTDLAVALAAQFGHLKFSTFRSHLTEAQGAVTSDEQ